MYIIDEQEGQYNKSSKLRKQVFKQFLANRYGMAVAEKWQNLIDFTIGVDFESYVNKIEHIFTNKQIMYQVAFDFYDCNNDEKISEIDTYKIFQFYGKQKQPKALSKRIELFKDIVQEDLVILIKVSKWLATEQ